MPNPHDPIVHNQHTNFTPSVINATTVGPVTNPTNQIAREIFIVQTGDVSVDQLFLRLEEKNQLETVWIPVMDTPPLTPNALEKYYITRKKDYLRVTAMVVNTVDGTAALSTLHIQ